MLQNLAYTGILLGVLVTVHELGHFLVAKACGVKVLKFSIGFGPRLIGFTRGETEYRISLLPLGGYVKMAGELPGEELEPEEARRGFLAQPPWKRGLIVAAGPFFNLVFPVLVYFFVFLGTREVLAPQVGSVDAGMPASGILEPGDRIVAVEGEPVRSFEEISRKVQPRFDRPLTLTLERNSQRREVTVTPMRATETNPVETSQRGYLGISSQARPAFVGVPVGSPAEAAGFRTFDRVVALNGQPVLSEVDLEKLLASAPPKLSVDVERETEVSGKPEKVTIAIDRLPGNGYAALGGESTEVYIYSVEADSPAATAGIKKGDRLTSFNGQSLASFRVLMHKLGDFREKPFELGWRSGTEDKKAAMKLVKREVKNELGAPTEEHVFGALPRLPKENEIPELAWVKVHNGPIEALAESMHVVPEVIRQTAMVIGKLFTGEVAFKTVGGPLMLYDLASKTAQRGVESFLGLMAVISVNLGMMNLLPIPVLDGFQLVASIWEGVRRRPIPTRVREIANAVGLAMLLILMILVFKNDLTR